MNAAGRKRGPEDLRVNEISIKPMAAMHQMGTAGPITFDDSFKNRFAASRKLTIVA